MPAENSSQPTPDLAERIELLERKVAGLEGTLPAVHGEAIFAALVAPAAFAVLVQRGALTPGQATELIDHLTVLLERRRHPLPDGDRAALDAARSSLEVLLARYSATPR